MLIVQVIVSLVGGVCGYNWMLEYSDYDCTDPLACKDAYYL